jgi:hypothetical protein
MGHASTDGQTGERKGKARGGRPIKGDGPAFRDDELDRLLVHGEADGDGIAQYPTYRDLAARYGVAHSVIADYSTRHNCLARRKEAQDQVRALVAQKLVESRAMSTADETKALLAMLDDYFAAFAAALKEGRVRTDNIADFDKACRLKAFLAGDSESRKEVVSGGITLEYLQERHREYLEQLARTTPEMTGVVVRPWSSADVVDVELVDDDDDGATDVVEPARS